MRRLPYASQPWVMQYVEQFWDERRGQLPDGYLRTARLPGQPAQPFLDRGKEAAEANIDTASDEMARVIMDTVARRRAATAARRAGK